MSENIPDISIIVPIYNNEQYLLKCFESLCAQTLSDFEVILVDDGSTDKTASICRAYCERDARFKYFYKPNGGLVSARKFGIEKARGKYIGYVDADDWIDPDMYEFLLARANEFDCDFVSSGIIRQFGEKEVQVGNAVPDGFYEGEDYERDVLGSMLYHGVFYDMGVRPNLVNKLFLREKLYPVQMTVPEEITNGEDVTTFCSYAVASTSCFLTSRALYHYRQHNESMTRGVENSDTVIRREKQIYEFLQKQFTAVPSEQRLKLELLFFIANLLVQKSPSFYDRQRKKLSIFGGVADGSRLVIYGAGSFGRQIRSCVEDYGIEFMQVDKNADFYLKQGIDVRLPDEIIPYDPDVVLIAVIDERMADEIKKELMGMGVQDGKIHWLDVPYITSEETLEKLGFC